MSKSDKCAQESLLLRVVWMLIYFFVWQLAELLLLGIALAQLIIRIVRGAPNDALKAFGGNLSRFLAQVGRFATFQTDDKPWPFADWPVDDAAPIVSHDLTKPQP
ncbi:DUF4389 domain-containing protein [Pseudomonas matsuisoli]|uniref:Lipase n=1 Tax=Pseudomonas matsuisoli TaxID=1515666 RepID=A0A917V0Q1_9PSED|nr:DUF4389 domain-containing protein [Pseudomonas matsuisoli]GGK05772.1 lipase [Pseudomonas matsuisoli]